MTSYRLVLVSDEPNSERTGYVHCADDQQACSAARTLLQVNLEYRVVYAYDGDRLVCELARDQRRFAGL